ncbi:hypothetical protein [Caulobacter sp. 17J80-11]|uniref:hypothetical protein n=1 Tax=Caulobacter sp. 17J80-11 TaxID=2763502 RepID=UPI0016534759|nr:hypothetical protein [Caulobacter sp. 17J80-11]MBC6982942.1 hypothetical protein [Caulobacter sp. 17J80-11]
MRLSLSVLAATALLAACGPRDASEPAAEPASAPGEAAATTAQTHSWTVQVSGTGVALTAVDPAGAALVTLACARKPAELIVTVEGFAPVGSEEQLSVGVDDEPFLLVADPTKRPAGVEARGPIPEDFLKRLETAREVRAVYGAQTLGPLAPPDAETAKRFAGACREARKG